MLTQSFRQFTAQSFTELSWIVVKVNGCYTNKTLLIIVLLIIMRLNTMFDELVNLLYQNCVIEIQHLKEELAGKSVFSYCILANDGFCMLGGSTACSREHLKEHIILLQSYGEKDCYNSTMTTCAEWDFMCGNNSHYSDDLAKAIDLIKLNIEEGGFEDINEENSKAFFVSLLVAVINKLKINNILQGPPFEKDLLLGVQYTDTSEYEAKVIIAVSAEVNSPEWHQRILQNYDRQSDDA